MADEDEHEIDYLAVLAGLGITELRVMLQKAIDEEDYRQADALLTELIGEDYWRRFVQHHLQRPGPRRD